MSDHLAQEADRLSSDPLFLDALAAIKLEALTALAQADADDKTAILRLQQKVAVVEEIRNVLARFIMNGQAVQEDASPYA